MFVAIRRFFNQFFGGTSAPHGGSMHAASSDANTTPNNEVEAQHATNSPSNTSLVPYDENLLERSRTQWQFGDWVSLAALEHGTLQHHPDRAKLALLAAAGRLQIDKVDEAKQYIRLSQDWGISKKLLTRILAAGVHNNLGRAAALLGEQPRAVQHFHSALAIGTPGSEARLLAQARISHQYQQLGLPPVAIGALANTVPPIPRGFPSVTPTFLKRVSD